MKTGQLQNDGVGKLTMYYKADLEQAGFDNIQFHTGSRVVMVEDRGDTLHSEANALDSGWVFDVRQDYSNPSVRPVHMIAEGRDPLATIDAGLLGSPGFQNEGDNEITGIHVSDGDASVNGLLGYRIPRPFHDGWRVFYTQQHGQNITWEILPVQTGYDDED
jgi:hypothetical protein